jgi:hypothetical protein
MIKKNKLKVFCEECKYYGMENYGDFISDWRCMHEKNKISAASPIWRDVEPNLPLCVNCNKNNNCKLFELGKGKIL